MLTTAIDVVQLSAHYLLTNRDPAAAWRMYWWGLGEWLMRAWIIPAAAVAAQILSLDGHQRRRHIGISFVLSIVLGAFAMALSVPFVVPQFLRTPPPLGETLFETYTKTFVFLLSRYYLATIALYWLTIGAVQALKYHNQYVTKLKDAARLQRRSMELEMSLTHTRLEALKSQIHPHFIFNTLNAVAVLAREKQHRKIVETTTRLARLLRAAIDQDTIVGPLREELLVIRNYLYIERLRFGRRLEIYWDIYPAALAVQIPRFSIQPLVENAIKHGVSGIPDAVQVTVGATIRGEHVVIWVHDTGKGLIDGSYREGVGLRNVRMRLQYIYGDDYSLTVSDNPIGGVRAEMSIPTYIDIHRLAELQVR